jgi:starch-binding outer membrane protein, SusD/RagB family
MALAAGLVLAGGCFDNTIVTPENAPTTDALAGELTSAGVQTLAYGVLANDRTLINGDKSYLVLSAIYARDAYRIDPNEPRYVSETLGSQADPGGVAGSGGWTNGFVTIRAANGLLQGLPGALAAQVSPGQKAVTAGFIKTIKALEYYRLLELRDSLGVPIQSDDATIVNPISCKATVLTYIASLLDSARADLASAPDSTQLPFAPPTGFTAYGRNYRIDSNIVKLNRGLKGKVSVYRGLQRPTPTPGAFASAITELTQALTGAAPGAVPSSRFQTGAYVTFVSGAENSPSTLSDVSIGVNPRAQAALQPGDTRASKIIPRAALTGQGLTTSLTYVGSTTAVAANLTRPVGILRDEEVVLLRAQAYIEANQLANATADLNSVRTAYGLAAYPVFADQASARTALLYEKRFSLFFEGPQRLVDLRAYGLLRAGITPAEVTGDPFNTALPIPKAEADARGGRDKLTPVCS